MWNIFSIWKILKVKKNKILIKFNIEYNFKNSHHLT